jgi:hypothetical protein
MRRVEVLKSRINLGIWATPCCLTRSFAFYDLFEPIFELELLCIHFSFLQTGSRRSSREAPKAHLSKWIYPAARLPVWATRPQKRSASEGGPFLSTA